MDSHSEASALEFVEPCCSPMQLPFFIGLSSMLPLLQASLYALSMRTVALVVHVFALIGFCCILALVVTLWQRHVGRRRLLSAIDALLFVPKHLHYCVGCCYEYSILGRIIVAIRHTFAYVSVKHGNAIHDAVSLPLEPFRHVVSVRPDVFSKLEVNMSSAWVSRDCLKMQRNVRTLFLEPRVPVVQSR